MTMIIWSAKEVSQVDHPEDLMPEDILSNLESQVSIFIYIGVLYCSPIAVPIGAFRPLVLFKIKVE